MPTTTPDPLTAARARRWWATARRIGRIERAAAFIDDVGFALLFPKKGVALPSLYEVAIDVPFEAIIDEWGPEMERLWGWKDELPRRGLAWYGPFLRGRKSFLSPALLADLYPRRGEPDDFLGAELSRDARRIAEVVLASGPTASAVLREATGMLGKREAPRFSRALDELGRALVLTHFGVEDEGAGWPSAVMELTARAFHLRPEGEPAERRARAAGRFLDTVIVATPADLGRAFRWPLADARAVLDGLVARGSAARDRSSYRLA